MSRIEGTTSLQTKFLRAFKTHPDGPPPELWPSPAVFRNWLRPPAFRTRPQAIVAAVRCPTHPRRALAADRSAAHLATSAAHDSTQDKQDNHLLLRLHHLHYLRQPKPAATPARGLAGPTAHAKGKTQTLQEPRRLPQRTRMDPSRQRRTSCPRLRPPHSPEEGNGMRPKRTDPPPRAPNRQSTPMTPS